MLEYSIEKKEYSHTCYERKTIYSFLVLVSIGKNKVRYLLAFLKKTKPHKQNERGSEIFQPFLVVLGRTLKLCTTETSCVGSEEEKAWLESPCYATWLKNASLCHYSFCKHCICQIGHLSFIKILLSSQHVPWTFPWVALLKKMLLNKRNNGPISLRQRSVLYYAYNLKYVLEKSLKQVHQTIFISKAAFLVFLITRQTHSYGSVNKNKTTCLHLAFVRRKHY